MSGGSQDHATRRVLVLGATGTIGRAVVRELTASGAQVSCLVRDVSKADAIAELAGAELIAVDLADQAAVDARFAESRFDAVISCLASRSGAPKDAWAVDYEANRIALEAARTAGVGHFVLLSAICVQKPLLAFQHAKLAFEEQLEQSGLTWSIVRPTAFFKSLSGQIDRVCAGKPFLVFGNGELTRCKPISDRDLARFIVGCLDDPERHDRILPIGGAGPAIGPKDQAAMLSELLGRDVATKSVPVGLFSAIAAMLGLGARLSDWCAAKAEYARIARYYATESMLLLDPATGEYTADGTPEFGLDTLRDHYAALLADRLPDQPTDARPATG